ncbi:hypothetical protein B6U67_00745 [Methanosarcinales archaeon ex4484_138]|nr:MAG: hypothetical protein B6U67_00745 [Methanosarcinales archaeon ex4484_138]
MQIKIPRRLLPSQAQFLKSNARYKLFSGAYGAGKTKIGCIHVILECLQNPGSLWLVGTQTYPMLRDTVVRTFFEEIELYQKALEEAGIKESIIQEWNKTEMRVRFVNGSEVLFRSCEDPAKFKSLNLDGWYLDEAVEVSEGIFRMLQGRLRGTHTKKHRGLITTNPSGYSNWVYRYFIEKPIDDSLTIHSSTFNNIFLPPEYINDLKNSYDEDYARRYLHGEWGTFEGIIYKDFSHQRHIGEYHDHEFKYYIGGYDDGQRNPASLLVIGVDSDDRYYVVEEFYQAGLTSVDIVERVKEINKKYDMDTIYCDPSGLNTIMEMKRAGLPAKDADNAVLDGIKAVASMFKQDRLFIDVNCTNLLRELESYRWEKDKAGQNLTEKPLKLEDHAVDSLRYICFSHEKRGSFTVLEDIF